MTHQEYVSLLKTAALETGKRAVMEYIVARVPFFGFKIINPIAGFVVGKVLSIAIEQTELGAFFLYIDLRTARQGRDFEAAAMKNALAQKSGTPDERQHAEAELIRAFRALAKFTN